MPLLDKVNKNILLMYSCALTFALSAMEAPETIEIKSYDVGHYIGRRERMEDRDSINITFQDNPSNALLGMYDGHRGTAAVEYVSRELPKIFEKNIKSKNPKKAFEDTFAETDKNLVSAKTGTTAIVVFKKGNTLYVANAGDSRAILSRNGKALVLNTDHRYQVNQGEKNRIDRLGGAEFMLKNWSAGPSRALGDHDLFASRPRFIIPTPEIKEFQLTPADEFLIVACDGVFEVMNDQEAVDIARKSLQSNQFNPKKAFTDLIETAYNKGSQDNISAMIAIFGKSREGAQLPTQPTKAQQFLPQDTTKAIQAELRGNINGLPDTESQDLLLVKQLLKETAETLKARQITTNELNEAIAKLTEIKEFITNSPEQNISFNSKLYGRLTLNQFLNIAIHPVINNIKNQLKKLTQIRAPEKVVQEEEQPKHVQKFDQKAFDQALKTKMPNMKYEEEIYYGMGNDLILLNKSGQPAWLRIKFGRKETPSGSPQYTRGRGFVSNPLLETSGEAFLWPAGKAVNINRISSDRVMTVRAWPKSSDEKKGATIVIDEDGPINQIYQFSSTREPEFVFSITEPAQSAYLDVRKLYYKSKES